MITGCTQQENEQPPVEEDQEEVEQDEDNQENQPAQDNTLDKEEAEHLIQSFRDQLIQETDEHLKVKNFNNKEELVNQLTKLADPELAKEYVDLFYKEENGDLYIIPKGGPVLLNKDLPYELAKNEGGLYYITQNNETEAKGKYSLYILFNQSDGKWIIQDIKLDVEEQHDPEDIPDQKKEEPAEDVIYSKQQIEQKGHLLLVNKSHALPEDYVPEELVIPDVLFTFEEQLPKKQMQKEAARALEEMFQQAKAENINLYAVSGYRSYERQDQIFQYNVNQHGEEYANQFSARPGESEHQTGLTMDITSRSANFGLIQQFGETKEGKWVAENAHQYGFIVRYPENQEDITGYIYEPWHLRYIGKEAAKEVYKRKVTLEEFVNSMIPKG
ncbi:hypothetical protein GH754_12750 [Salinibacillus xinjiangensis]|uniref:D-alanyl-D-alanine carboxypeptidase-like core domain-containing protein n=2 Tax=Salinibacillus xinjiangensis TaxID=1229268 RepID=A0A6G1X8P6_9BACI|nr:hypothetical protein [Salinibacillus xinjiangensis]